MNEKNLISVVIPTYNRARVILRAINSVIRQTYTNFELIVVDDGSTDDTKKIVLSIQDERIRYEYQKNQGAQVARNTGLNMAQGKYVAFLDSDDEWAETFLFEAKKKFEGDKTIGCVYCLMGSKDSVEKVDTFYNPLQGDIYCEALEQGYITAPSSLIIRKSCFDAIGNWDTSFCACQDDDMCFRLAKHFRFALIPKVLCVVHTDDYNSETRISASKARVANGWWQLWNKYENEVLRYCGARTMGKHYLNCAWHFAKANNVSMRDEAISRAMKLCDFETGCDNFLKTISPKALYCYGAGEYARNIAKYLLTHKYRIEAFLVSDANLNDKTLLDIPVIDISALDNKGDFSVLLATSKKYHGDIKKTLDSFGIDNVYAISEEFYNWMRVYVMRRRKGG